MTGAMAHFSWLHSAGQGAPRRRTRCTEVHHSTARSPAVAARKVHCSPEIPRSKRAAVLDERSFSTLEKNSLGMLLLPSTKKRVPDRRPGPFFVRT
jgi:hypothetical protein